MYDFVIIGAGVSGCFLAHKLAHYDYKVAVVDKENDIANGTTMANSAIIHAGEDPEDGTLKAELNVRGSRMYPQICKELHCRYENTSAYIVAGAGEEAHLEALKLRADKRGIPANFLSGEEARKQEPNLSDAIVKVLELPTTAIVCPWEVAIALAEEAALNGVEFMLNREVTAIGKTEQGYCVKTAEGNSLETKWVINAAGVFADKIAKMVSPETSFTIRARKGEYFVLDHDKAPLVSRVIYPTPSALGKGVLAVPTVHGNVLLGPNSEYTDCKDSVATTTTGMDYVRTALSRTVKNVPWGKVIRSFAGLRATGSTGDFIIEEGAPGFINVAAIESPGLSSAPAIAEYVFDTFISVKEIVPAEKTDFVRRTPYADMEHMTEEEKNELVKKDPNYGHIICRCEQVTEGEILEAIHRPLGARTVKAVKKRVRPGMGRCQGGFCEPHVVKLLERELNQQPEEVAYDEAGSVLLKGGAL